MDWNDHLLGTCPRPWLGTCLCTCTLEWSSFSVTVINNGLVCVLQRNPIICRFPGFMYTLILYAIVVQSWLSHSMWRTLLRCASGMGPPETLPEERGAPLKLLVPIFEPRLISGEHGVNKATMQELTFSFKQQQHTIKYLSTSALIIETVKATTGNHYMTTANYDFPPLSKAAWHMHCRRTTSLTLRSFTSTCITICTAIQGKAPV